MARKGWSGFPRQARKPLFRGPFRPRTNHLRRILRQTRYPSIPLVLGFVFLFSAGGASWVSGVGRDIAVTGNHFDGDGCTAPLPDNTSPFSGRVIKIIDGDSICVDGIEVRLGDFDAPEWNAPGGRAAKTTLTSLVAGREVTCAPCEGARSPGRCISFDRIIATCRTGGRRLGDLMRERGVREGGR